MSKELIQMSAIELLDGYRSGNFSPVEATQAVLDRIHSVNDKINPVVTFYEVIQNNDYLSVANQIQKTI